jgi:DNA-binding Lrp family transcriptional regulator
MMGDWTFFSNHGHVLVCLARDHEARLRDVAVKVGITERAVQKIVRDLQDAGFITIRKQGRRNRYQINRRKSLRHLLESHVTVGKLLTLVAAGGIKPSQGVHEPEPAKQNPPAPEPVPEPEAESKKEDKEEKSKKPARVEASDGKARKEEDEENNGKSKPIDIRQQGSLF